jgi:phosphate transport system substrate-binding protein
MKKHIALLLALAAATAAVAEKLVIKGSDTLGAKLVPMLAEAYKAKHPEIVFEIAAEGSTTGIAAIIDGTAMIGMSSRPVKSTEESTATTKGVKLTPTVVAFDGMALIVNEMNPVANMTKRQIEQVFTGDMTDWAALGGTGGPISVYTRNTSSGTYSEWKEMAMNKRDYGSSAQKMAGNEQIASEVSANPNGVGYVGLAYTHAPGIKVVSVDGVFPNKESINAKKYPLARPTFYYTNGQPAGEAANFVNFTLSVEGQAIVEKVGFVPVH